MLESQSLPEQEQVFIHLFRLLKVL